VFETQYKIELPVYEGPLDLLLDLINRAELDITKIALAQVTDQYLAYLRQVPEHGLADLSSFLVIAARLLLIKSEALLPRPPQREVGEEDPGDALARQLLAYKKYKEVALLLGERDELGLRTYLRISPPPNILLQLDLTEFDLNDLHMAYREAIANRERPSLRYVVSPPRISIRDRIILIIDQLRKKGRTTFSTLLKSTQSRLEIVISFLAVLELVKQHQVEVTQEKQFGEIEIKPGGAWQEDQDFEFDLEFDE
jgi:segregation and condensation protein A